MATATSRDPRVDVLRGAALLMIFIDHVPGNDLAWFTLHDFGFCDAAEIFVLLAGFSATLAYGKVFERDGPREGLRRIALRCLRIYATQIGLLLATLAIVQAWTSHFGLVPLAVSRILDAGAKGVEQGLLLQALPGYLDILPLYVVLLAIFPLIYLPLRRFPRATVAASAAVWAVALFVPALNLPNWLDEKGWYFDPFSWQFLFTLGMAAALLIRTRGPLPQRGWLVAACVVFLAFAFVETAPFRIWHVHSLRLFPMDTPDKSRLEPLRIVDIAALFYLLMSSAFVLRVSATRLLRPLEACGRHSLYVFALGCLLALLARLTVRVLGYDWPMQVAVNVVGLGGQCLLALWLERQRLRAMRANAAAAPPASGGRLAAG